MYTFGLYLDRERRSLFIFTFIFKNISNLKFYNMMSMKDSKNMHGKNEIKTTNQKGTKNIFKN